MNIVEKSYSLNGVLKKRAKTDTIFLHHASAKTCTPEQVDSWHKQRGWTCIGYHFLVRKDGTIYRGRQEDVIGAHVTNYNATSIGICAEGNFEIEQMPEVQKRALTELVSYLKKKYSITKVLKHKYLAATDCPGKNYPFEEIANRKCDNIKYEVHIQNIGWQECRENGQLAGTTGQALRMEAIKIYADIPIKYRVHMEDKGWGDYVSNGCLAGTIGESRRIEAIEIESSSKTIKAQAHIENIGNQDVVQGTHIKIGTEGQALRLEALKLEFV